MAKVLEKAERRIGEKLFLKGDRCLGPKCAVTRRQTPPGVHGPRAKGRRRNRSEFSILLTEKQKVRLVYGLDDKDIERYSNKASSERGIYSEHLIILLETRLDNAVFRSGFADSRRMARFLVSHGHITVNNRSLTIPSYRVKKGDAISVKAVSLSRPLFQGIEAKLAKVQVPKWIILDSAKKTAVISSMPGPDDLGLNVDVTKIKEFYSR